MTLTNISTAGLEYTRKAIRDFLHETHDDSGPDVPVSAIGMPSATFRISARVARLAAQSRLQAIETELRERSNT